MNKKVTRAFISSTYGGSPFKMFPVVGDHFRAQHNHQMLFLSTSQWPEAPRQPGSPGLLCTAQREPIWRDKTVKLFMRPNCDKMWWYMGDYRFQPEECLSAAEFSELPDEVRVCCIGQQQAFD